MPGEPLSLSESQIMTLNPARVVLSALGVFCVMGTLQLSDFNLFNE